MLRVLDIKAASVAAPLLHATIVIGNGGKAKERPTGFLRRGSKWHRHLNDQAEDSHRLWEVAVLFHLRDAFRSGDIWLPQSRRYGDLKQVLIPTEAAQIAPKLAMPLDPEVWLTERKAPLPKGLTRLALAHKNNRTRRTASRG